MWGLADGGPFTEEENAKREQVGGKGCQITFGQVDSEVPVQSQEVMSSRY